MRAIPANLTIILILFASRAISADLPVMSQPANFDIIRNKPCEVMESTMDWKNGASIPLNSVQEKIKIMPTYVSLTPTDAANQVLNLSGVETVKFYCQDSTVDNRVATLTLTYETSQGTYVLPAITVTIDRPGNN
jgi:hypothetical protein